MMVMMSKGVALVMALLLGMADAQTDCTGVICGGGEVCDAGACVCADGYELVQDGDDSVCAPVHSWDNTWLACPAWYAYARHGRCPDENGCEVEATEQEIEDFCLEFMSNDDCAADPNAVRVLSEQCGAAAGSFGAALNDPCTPWEFGASPCADGQCVNEIYNSEPQGPACYPFADTFAPEAIVPYEEMMCEHDSDCLASYECVSFSDGGSSWSSCMLAGFEFGCDVDDMFHLDGRTEADDGLLPDVSLGCAVCMAEYTDDEEMWDNCFPETLPDWMECDAQGENCCISAGTLPEDTGEEGEIMDAMHEFCGASFEPCFGAGVTMFELDTCGAQQPACYAAINACMEVELIPDGDGSECTDAGDCEITTMTITHPEDDTDILLEEELCVPVAAMHNGAGRDAVDCFMDFNVEFVQHAWLEETRSPTCNFGALMATVESALTNGDLTALLDDQVYQDCDAVADAIGAAQITAQCP